MPGPRPLRRRCQHGLTYLEPGSGGIRSVVAEVLGPDRGAGIDEADLVDARAALLTWVLAEAARKQGREHRLAQATRLRRLLRMPAVARPAAAQLLDVLATPDPPGGSRLGVVLDRLGEALPDGHAALWSMMGDVDDLESGWREPLLCWLAMALDVHDQLVDAGQPVDPPAPPRRGRLAVWGTG